MASRPDPHRGITAGDLTVHVPDEAALTPLARRLVAVLPRPAFVAMRGDLGAGKTTLVKALAAAVGIEPSEVVSPTFGLVHEHAAAQGILLHADMYRLVGPDDLHEIGWHDAVARAAWAFVEWPERIADALPSDRLDIAITIDSPFSRSLRLTGRGPAHAAAVEGLRG
jgi:tRNA threonylcarbamoyl adenosine modification protein YjeE